MVDKVSAGRRRIMQANKSKNTKPEIKVRKIVHALGGRFRLHRKDLPGKPDLVLPKRKLCIFIHGSFWHQHQNCYLASKPKKNIAYWDSKFSANKARDIRNIQQLKELGWNVEIVWECELDHPEKRKEKLKGILSTYPYLYRRSSKDLTAIPNALPRRGGTALPT